MDNKRTGSSSHNGSLQTSQYHLEPYYRQDILSYVWNLLQVSIFYAYVMGVAKQIKEIQHPPSL